MQNQVSQLVDGVRARRAAVFFDRDGTLNENPVSGDFVRRAADLRMLPDIAAPLGSLHGAGFALVVFSNQSGIARGLMTREDVDGVNARMQAELAREGVPLDGIYVCPHDAADRCECRKPKPGLIVRAARDLGLDLTRSWAVGDSARDIEAARGAGCRAILVYGNSYPGQRAKAEALGPDASVSTLADAAAVILGSAVLPACPC